MRVIDYREEPPKACPDCGGEISVYEMTGNVYIHGPADLEFAAKYGIFTEGPITTLWREWECANDPNHDVWSPVLLA